MKNKTTKILCIISIIVFVLGILCWLGTNSLINQTDNITFLLSLFGAIALRLLIVAITIGIIAIMWLIYGIIILYKRIKSGSFKWKNLIIVGISIVLIIIVAIIMTSLLNISNVGFTKNKYDYSIKYQDGVNIYNIYKTGKEIEVYADEQVICDVAPCPTFKSTRNINFSDDNMIIVNDFIDSFFGYHEYNSIQIFKENLTDEQNNILDSIIYNDESLLNKQNVEISSAYTIITDMRWKTMQDDGGSNFNIYYEINLNNNIVKKYEDHYIGFKGYEYQKKLLYEKSIDNNINFEINNLLTDLLSKDDVNDTNNYSPYTIKNGSQEKDIYNEKSINLLNNILNKIDNMGDNYEQ